MLEKCFFFLSTKEISMKKVKDKIKKLILFNFLKNFAY